MVAVVVTPILAGRCYRVFSSGGASDDYSSGAAPDNSQIAPVVPDIQAQFRSRGFWFLVVIFVIGAAWYASDKKRGDS